MEKPIRWRDFIAHELDMQDTCVITEDLEENYQTTEDSDDE